jgi:hypothetical protein
VWYLLVSICAVTFSLRSRHLRWENMAALELEPVVFCRCCPLCQCISQLNSVQSVFFVWLLLRCLEPVNFRAIAKESPRVGHSVSTLATHHSVLAFTTCLCGVPGSQSERWGSSQIFTNCHWLGLMHTLGRTLRVRSDKVFFFFFGSTGVRAQGLLVARQMLHHLSHSPSFLHWLFLR